MPPRISRGRRETFHNFAARILQLTTPLNGASYLNPSNRLPTESREITGRKERGRLRVSGMGSKKLADEGVRGPYLTSLESPASWDLFGIWDLNLGIFLLLFSYLG